MRTQRFFTSEFLQAGEHVALGEKAAHYLSRVLRLSPGARLNLFNGDGFEYHCELEGFRGGRARALVLERIPGQPDSPLRIMLSQAISRGDRMDYCLQKATELGVAEVQLLVSERVEVKLSGARLEKRMAHWLGVMRSASEQCGRATVPDLHEPLSLHQWAEMPGAKLVLDAGATLALRDARPGNGVNLAVGPEGGFSEAELEILGRGGVQSVRLGPRVLRTETAGPAAIAVLQAMAGDLS